MIRYGLVVAFTGLREFFNHGVFHHPVSRTSAGGIFIFRRCMVRHLRFLLSLASRPLSQIDYLRARHVYCASVSLGVPVTLALRVLSIHSVSFSCLGFFGRVYAPPSLGALGHVFLACPWPSLECFLSAFWAMTWWPLSSSLTPNLLALSAPGAAFFRLFLGYDSLFISVLARLLGPSLAFPVLRF